MNDSEDIILCIILISRLKLWPVTEEHANITQMFSATSVGVLLHPNSDRKLQILWGKKAYFVKFFDIKKSF